MHTNEQITDLTPNPPPRRKSILKNNYLIGAEIEKKKINDKPSRRQSISIQIPDKKEKDQTIKKPKKLNNPWNLNNIRDNVIMLFDHNAYITLVSFLTIYSLFADDVRMGFLPITCDFYIDILLVISMAFYGIECLLSCVFKSGYIFSFYFFIDFFSTSSIVFDVLWLFNPYNTYEDYFQSKYI